MQNGAPKGPRSNAVTSATASMETVERAIGDLRVDGPSGAPQGGRGGRRGGRNTDNRTSEVKVPTTDFDFESSNARFDKSSLGPTPKANKPTSGDVTPSGEEGAEDDAETKDKETAYNPKKSFFDSLSPGTNEQPSGGRGRGGRRGGGGRNRREEERERNVATFGEPGGIGLMGPGAYVGGWGGYGRRGGGRGRRGGGPGGNPRQ
jgi:protein LSM14